MSDPLELARPELLRLRPYTPGAYEPDCVRLNANESPWRAPGDTTERGLNRYPPPRPQALRRRLAEHYGTAPERMLVTRGSSEAIDVLIRGFCAAGRDRILVCPPTFDMYRVYATIQDAGIVTAPLIRERDFALDTAALLAVLDDDADVKLVFICSPNNPTGQSMNRADIEAVCEALTGRALLVLDEAYHEFAEADDFMALAERHAHVVLLRTLSKFVSLAGVRCGALIAAPQVVEFLENVLPPYTFPTPSIELVLKALSKDSLQVSRERVTLIKRERERLTEALRDVPQVVNVWPSDANFVLIEARDGARFSDQARAAGILVRLFPGDPTLTNCVRITVGRPEDNDRLLQAVAGAGPLADGPRRVPAQGRGNG
jgi:histidinol-phosphate aminotransferase